MPRLRELTSKDDLPAEAHAAFDEITTSRGSVSAPWTSFIHSPEVAARSAHLGTYILFESSLPRRAHELAMIVAAHELDETPDWADHVREAREAGIAESTMEAIEKDSDITALPDEDALIVRFGRDLLRKRHVDDATFENARSRFGERGVVDLIGTFAYMALVGSMLNALDVEFHL